MNAKNKVFDCFNQMMGQITGQPVKQQAPTNADYAAGYIINAQGEALKITDAMIKQAYIELKARCYVPNQS